MGLQVEEGEQITFFLLARDDTTTDKFVYPQTLEAEAVLTDAVGGGTANTAGRNSHVNIQGHGTNAKSNNGNNANTNGAGSDTNSSSDSNTEFIKLSLKFVVFFVVGLGVLFRFGPWLASQCYLKCLIAKEKVLARSRGYSRTQGRTDFELRSIGIGVGAPNTNLSNMNMNNSHLREPFGRSSEEYTAMETPRNGAPNEKIAKF